VRVKKGGSAVAEVWRFCAAMLTGSGSNDCVGSRIALDSGAWRRSRRFSPCFDPSMGLILPTASISTITFDAHQRAIGFPPCSSIIDPWTLRPSSVSESAPKRFVFGGGRLDIKVVFEHPDSRAQRGRGLDHPDSLAMDDARLVALSRGGIRPRRRSPSAKKRKIPIPAESVDLALLRVISL
jgi:hypothetical protein